MTQTLADRLAAIQRPEPGDPAEAWTRFWNARASLVAEEEPSAAPATVRQTGPRDLRKSWDRMADQAKDAIGQGDTYDPNLAARIEAARQQPNASDKLAESGFRAINQDRVTVRPGMAPPTGEGPWERLARQAHAEQARVSHGEDTVGGYEPDHDSSAAERGRQGGESVARYEGGTR